MISMVMAGMEHTLKSLELDIAKILPMNILPALLWCQWEQALQWTIQLPPLQLSHLLQRARIQVTTAASAVK